MASQVSTPLSPFGLPKATLQGRAITSYLLKVSVVSGTSSYERKSTRALDVLKVGVVRNEVLVIPQWF